VKKEVFTMLHMNLFRPLPPGSHELGLWKPEEDEPRAEATWPHLQVS
jgi:hypothetical protein